MFWKRNNPYDFHDYTNPEGSASSHWRKAIGYSAPLVAGVILSVYFGMWDPVPPPLPENLCPVGAVPATQVVVLVDKTDDYTPDQQHALESSLREHLHGLRLGERLTLYQMTPGANAVVQLLYDRCRPKTEAEADPIQENPKSVERDYQEQFVQPFEHALAALKLPEPSAYSPILEALYAIAHEAPLAEPAERRVIEIWSDMLAKSELIDMYQPNYSFEQLRQADSLYLEVLGVRGSDVRIFQLANRYPAYQNGRHAKFWAEYFRHARVAENQLAMRRL
ncbi:MAG: hypothetical protein ACRER2_01920 [Methylococcales bacterium]